MSKRRSSDKDALEVSDLFLKVLIVCMLISGLLVGLNFAGLMGNSFSFWPELTIISVNACVLWVLWERFVVKRFSMRKILIGSVLLPILSFISGCAIILGITWGVRDTAKNMPSILGVAVGQSTRVPSAPAIPGLPGQPTAIVTSPKPVATTTPVSYLAPSVAATNSVTPTVKAQISRKC